MIPLHRIREKDVIDKNFQGDKREQFELDLLFDRRSIVRKDKDANGKLITKHNFKSARWGKAKAQLRVETHDKCAYCEAPSQAVAHGDVEHYRPKKVYWWLAYNYENYLVSCQLCNQKFKSANFPIDNGQLDEPEVSADATDADLKAMAGKLGPDSLVKAQVRRFARDHKREKALLLNPYFDDPGPIIGYELSHVTKEVFVVPDPDSDEAPKLVEAAEEFYGLNRPELRSLRYTFAKPYALARMIRDRELPSGLPDDFRAQLEAESTTAAADIEAMIADDHPFAGMIRYFELFTRIPEMEDE